MRVIDLLNKIANKEEMPQKIKYGDKIYEWKEYDCGYEKKKKIDWVKKWGYVAELNRTYFYLEHCFKDLNDEVEIIEEDKKIEKLDIQLSPDDENKVNFYRANNLECDLAFKINEIIEVLNERL